MPVIAVINRKGGSGKTTLATHLAGCLANRGLRVMLADADRQQSAAAWSRRRATRAPTCAPVVSRTIDLKSLLRPPAGISHVVIDTPGGLQGFDLARILMFADMVLMPLCNSAFDRESAAACLADVRRHPRVASGRCKVAAVGMRIDSRTSGQQRLRDWAQAQGLTFIGVLRETQTYVRCVERGLTIFDLPATRVQVDLDQWLAILQWLAPLLDAPPAPQPAHQRPTAPAGTAIAPRVVTAHAGPARPLAPTPSNAGGLRKLLGWLLPLRPTPGVRP